MKIMDRKVAVYIPVGYTSVLSMVQEVLADKFGGTTTFHTDNSWIDGEGDLVEKGVEVVISWYSSKEYIRVPAFIIDLATRVKAEANQDCVAVEVEEEMMLI